MTETKSYKIRNMKEKEIEIAVEWAAQEGWNPGIHDSQSFYKTDPNGFFLGELNGEPIGCISAVAYQNNFGFMGFYIVKSQYRGKGYGIQLWNRGVEYLKGRNIGLDGVVAQQENYKKSGFKLAYRNIRFEGTTKAVHVSEDLLNLLDIPFEEIHEYDIKMFSVPRPEFLKPWINQPKSVALGIKKDGNLAGYGVIRKCRKGYKIGPLFANDKETANKLFNGLVSKVKAGEPFYLDTPEPNKEAVLLAEKNKMTKVFETARMYTGEIDILPVNNIFGVTSFELG